MWFLVLAVCERMWMQGNSCLRGLKSHCVLWRALCTAICKSYLNLFWVKTVLWKQGFTARTVILIYLTDVNTHSTWNSYSSVNLAFAQLLAFWSCFDSQLLSLNHAYCVTWMRILYVVHFKFLIENFPWVGAVYVYWSLDIYMKDP